MEPLSHNIVGELAQRALCRVHLEWNIDVSTDRTFRIRLDRRVGEYRQIWRLAQVELIVGRSGWIGEDLDSLHDDETGDDGVGRGNSGDDVACHFCVGQLLPLGRV